mgnify:CR=1
MTSQLNVDTIVDKAGSGGSNVKMANTSTYVSEGGAKTANNVVQGLSKAWGNSNAAGTSIANSFNVTSLTDNDTGQQFFNITNTFSDASMGGGTAQTSVGNEFIASSNTTSQIRIYAFDGSSYQDQSVTWNMCGDLA